MAYKKFQKNFVKALDFGEGAEFIQELDNSPITVFMMHQAAELTFRGILQGLNGYDKETHEINVLRKLARRCAPQLCHIFSDDSKEEKRILDLLDNSYINARYDNDYHIAKEDLFVIYEKLLTLLEMARKSVLTTLGIPDPKTQKKYQ